MTRAALPWSPHQGEFHTPHYMEERASDAVCVHCGGEVVSRFWSRNGWKLDRCVDCEEPICRACAAIVEEDCDHRCGEVFHGKA